MLSITQQILNREKIRCSRLGGCVSKQQFKTAPESERQIDDPALSAAMSKALMDVGPDIKDCVDNHTASIETQAAIHAEKRIVNEIREAAKTFEGISDAKIECHPIVALSE